jgi:hypothetical protein
LIQGCLEYFHEDCALLRETLNESPPATLFKLTRRDV